MTPQDIAKRAVGAAAVERLVTSGMKLGLGSGSTSEWMVRALGERVRAGLDVVGVATSTTTAALAREVGVQVIELDEAGELDLTLDGADEIDHRLRMIKGGGACLLREKIVAAATKARSWRPSAPFPCRSRSSASAGDRSGGMSWTCWRGTTWKAAP